MTNQSGTKVTRRDFLKTTTVGTLAAGLGPFFLFPERAQAQQKTLKIIQWGHFVPAYDRWFDGVFTKHKHGRALPLAHRSTYNPKTKKYFAFSDSFLPNPSNWRKDLWEQAGYPNGPDTYDELRDGAKKIRDKLGNPYGMGLSRESDTNASLRAILWSFGGAEQDEHGNVTINSKQTVEAMKYMRARFTRNRRRPKSSVGTQPRTIGPCYPGRFPTRGTPSRLRAPRRKRTQTCRTKSGSARR
jgi:hypothetical protein